MNVAIEITNKKQTHLRLHLPIDGFWHDHFSLGNIQYKATVQSMKEDKDQESIQSSTTPDQGYQWECDNFTIRHHK